MGVGQALLEPLKAAVNTVVNPMKVPIQLLFTYPATLVFPHHELKAMKREGKQGYVGGVMRDGHWSLVEDPMPIYMKETNYRFRGLIGIDMERCTGCRRCERICPNKIIRMVPRSDEEVNELFPDLQPNLINKKKVYPEIYYGRCLYCGYCAEELVGGCPFDALNLTNFYDIADVFDDNLVFTPEKLQLVVEKVGRGTQNWWTQEPKAPKAKKPPAKKKPAAKKDEGPEETKDSGK